MTWKEIPGWFSDEDAAEYGRLLDQIRPGEVVAEIGSLAGRSSVFAAERIRPKFGKLLCVDMWQYGDELPTTGTEVYIEAGWPNIWATFSKNIGGHHDVITAIGKHSHDAAKLFRSLDAKFGLVYIDGAHDYDSVKADVEAWTPLVRHGGIVCGHDYNDPEVKRAVEDSLGTVEVGGTVWSYKIESASVQTTKKRGCGGCGKKIAPR